MQGWSDLQLLRDKIIIIIIIIIYLLQSKTVRTIQAKYCEGKEVMRIRKKLKMNEEN